MNISVENKMLQVENLSYVPFNDLLSLFRQGYRLAEHSESAVELGLNIGLDIRNNNGNIGKLATCTGSVTTGGTLTLSATASSGTAPYTYHWSVTKPDGTIDTSLTGSSNSYTFATNGSYTVSTYVTDSCVGGAKTSNTDSCVITASPVVGTKYNCVSGTCQGPFTTGTYDSLSACQTVCTGGGAGCTNCDATKNFCVAGQCIPKKYVLIGGIGLVALLVLRGK